MEDKEVIHSSLEKEEEEMELDEYLEKYAGDDDAKKEWYNTSLKYWSEKPATVNGVLDGHEDLSPIDISGSLSLIKRIKLKKPNLEWNYCLDCGAGIGRVTKLLLAKAFNNVDILEPTQHYIDTCREYVDNDRLKELYHTSLQEFVIPSNKYDVIWAQWCLLYLPNDAFVEFIRKALKALKKGGIIVIKENICDNESVYNVDVTDNSICRSPKVLRELIEKADGTVILEREQDDVPEHLYPVSMFVVSARGTS